MLGNHFSTILARTDPFDVALGVERHIRSLSAKHVRDTIAGARERMNDWYRAEFLPLLDERDDDRLKRGFAQALKSNLRAIPLFGPAFCEGVISQTPGDRTVALGEEQRPWVRFRPLAFAAIALTLLFGGAAAEHVISNARAVSEGPVVTITPTPQPMQTGQPALAVGSPKAQPPVSSPRPPVQRVAQTVPHAAVTRTTATQAPATQPPATQPPAQPAQTATPVSRPADRPRVAVARTPPPGRGVKTVVAAPPTPAPSPSAVDTSDMPQAFTDATPLPKDETAPPAQVPAATGVPTPTPAPNRSWTHRLVHAGVHLVNSTLTGIGVTKKPTPSPSPSGPQPS